MLRWDGREYQPLCHVYSDVSCRHGAIGYCCAVIQGDSGIRYYRGDATDCGNVIAAEIFALATGIGECPTLAERVIAHSDLAWLPSFMAGQRVSYEGKLLPQVTMLRDVIARFRLVQFRVVNRNNSAYRKCHRQSRLEAVDWARARRTFGRYQDRPAAAERG